MLELDGSEGGGQLLRSALALSALTGESFRMAAVRGDRDDPGLRPQHLACVRTLAAICDADLEGDEEGSTAVAFEPAAPAGGRYRAEIGTAGSVTLLFDAVLPLATAIDEPLAVTATGGTDVAWSPTIDHYRRVKLPLLRRFGVNAALEVERRGFYPAGGGRARLWLAPSDPAPIDLGERGDVEGVRIESTAAADLSGADVADRQAEAAAEIVDRPVVERTSRYVDADCPGSALAVRIDSEGSLAGVDALGERGKPSEEVAAEAAADLADFVASGAAVDRHTADQLIVPLAVAGGDVSIPAVTDHVETNRDLVERFGREVTIERDGATPRLVAPRRG